MIVKRCIRYLLLLLFLNVVILFPLAPGPLVAVPAAIVLGALYIAFNIVPFRDRAPQRRMRILNGGYELMLAAIWCFTLEILLYLYLLLGNISLATHILIINGVVCTLLLLVLLVNGLARIFTCSGQLGILPRVLLLFCWWVPVVNIVLLRRYLRVTRREYSFTVAKHRLDSGRRHEELCKTRYPLLMVHGVFFRDWKNFNYWGRIPGALTGNGATIHYGSHQSSAPVEQCGGELSQCIQKLVEETGCEKVNIIAHSKGGLDARYAISCLGMGGNVASLTTICTPHLGCNYVRKLLEVVPEKALGAIGRKYESLYTFLGDDNPDFFGGLANLTDKECAKLNEQMPDDPRVLYQSVGARMGSAASAMFPMNVGYRLIKLHGGGDNDGLTSTKSMVWGNFLGVVGPRGRQGISHADMIDLTRKNIEGFDVCEFYVDLVGKLKANGL